MRSSQTLAAAQQAAANAVQLRGRKKCKERCQQYRPRLAQEDVGENQDDRLVKLAGRARRFDAEEADAPPNAHDRTHARAVA